MLGSAIYHPHIDVDDPQFIRSSIIFWNNLHTIVPDLDRSPYNNEDSIICQKEGFLIGLKCSVFSDILHELSGQIARAVTSYDCEPKHFNELTSINPSDRDPISESNKKLEGFRHSRPVSKINTCKMNRHSIASMLYLELSKNGLPNFDDELLAHIDSYAAGDIDDIEFVFGFTEAEERLGNRFDNYFENDEKGEWLYIDSDLSHAYMTGLANKIGKQLDLSPITNIYPSQGMSARFLFEDYVEDSDTKAEGYLLTIFIRSLNIDPSIKIEKLLKFQKLRSEQIHDLRYKIIDLVEKLRNSISSGESDHSILDTARNIYARNVEPELVKLKSELNRNSIASTWEGCHRALTLSVPSAGAVKYFTNASTPLLLGAGMAVGFTDIAVKGYLAQRRTRENSPYTYLYDAHRDFGLPKFDE